MQGIVVQDSAKKPVIEIKKVSARIALRKLLQLKAGLAAITIDTLNATFVKDSTGSNYSFINRNKLSKVDNEVKQPEKNYCIWLTAYLNIWQMLQDLKESCMSLDLSLF
ncbi:MAG: hypothetical protein IPJ79_11235 [Bacteroidetes bacterium]|nr:hypothetical protein [Bacteroidota bacterium]